MIVIHIGNGSDCMTNSKKKTNIAEPPWVALVKLRKGEQVHCKNCKVGYMKPLGGNYKTTTTFICDKCKNQIIIN